MQNKKIFEKVVPIDQNFTNKYAGFFQLSFALNCLLNLHGINFFLGIFLFRFYIYGGKSLKFIFYG